MKAVLGPIVKKVLFLIWVFCQIDSLGQTYANLSFNDNFSGSGTALSSNWVTSFTNAAGRIDRRDLSGNWPQFGTTTGPSGTATSGSGMAIYNISNLASNNTLRADLHLRLLDATNAKIEFSAVDWGTGYAANPLNVFISTNGGSSFGTIATTVPLNLAPHNDGIWNNVSVNLNTLASANGLTLSNTTVVRLAFTLLGSGNTASPKSGNQFIYIDNFSATGSTPLPVELLSFSAKGIGAYHQLNWATLSEVDNSHFEVQRSTDGVNFETIGELLGNGTSNNINPYQFITAAVSGDVIYYRLKQIDFDGTCSFSSIEQIVTQKEIRIIFFNSKVYCANCDDGVLVVYDNTGKILETTVQDSGSSEINRSLDHLSNGIYYLCFMASKENAVFTSKIVINN